MGEFAKLDPLLHSELRLAVMSTLLTMEEADFVYLREATGATAVCGEEAADGVQDYGDGGAGFRCIRRGLEVLSALSADKTSLSLQVLTPSEGVKESVPQRHQIPGNAAIAANGRRGNAVHRACGNGSEVKAAPQRHQIAGNAAIAANGRKTMATIWDCMKIYGQDCGTARRECRPRRCGSRHCR